MLKLKFERISGPRNSIFNTFAEEINSSFLDELGFRLPAEMTAIRRDRQSLEIFSDKPGIKEFFNPQVSWGVGEQHSKDSKTKKILDKTVKEL